MKKRIVDFEVTSKGLAGGCTLLTLRPTDASGLEDVKPGMFVEVRIDTPGVLLRRPISVCDVTPDGRLVLFVKPAGTGTNHLCSVPVGTIINIMLPLGNGFTLLDKKKVLLVGGGVGAAPMVYLCRQLLDRQCDVTVALGARSATDLEGVIELFNDNAKIKIATDDGSLGHHGVVTQLDTFNEKFDYIYCCGPTPMMHAVAAIAREKIIPCEVSLENRMACGLGACLCCVEKTKDEGNVCVCTDGPVFNIDKLLWL